VPKLVYQLRQNRQNWHVVALRDTYSRLSAALKKAAELNKLPRVTSLSLGVRAAVENEAKGKTGGPEKDWK
jgi:hypothetical protein